jgi:hypothetical protein
MDALADLEASGLIVYNLIFAELTVTRFFRTLRLKAAVEVTGVS